MERSTHHLSVRLYEDIEQGPGRPRIVWPQMIPILRAMTRENQKAPNNTDYSQALGLASEDYIRDSLVPLLGTDGVDKIAQTRHLSKLDTFKIDIVVFYKEPINYTFIQVATTPWSAEKKRREVDNDILVLPALDFQERPLDPLLIQGAVRTWKQNPQKAEEILWKQLNNTRCFNIGS